MRIAVKRSGGYTGLEETGEVDTQALDAASAAELEALVRRARLFEPAADDAGAIGADLPRATITVRDGGRQGSRTFIDDGRPETAALNALVNGVLQRR